METPVNDEKRRAHKCLQELKSLIKTDDVLQLPEDDNFLLRFVRAKKYNSEIAYKNLKHYYEARLKYPKSYAKFYPSALQTALDSGILQLLKHRDKLGRRVVVFRIGLWDVEKFNFDEVTMASVIFAEQVSWSPDNQMSGAVVILDETGLNMTHMRQLTLQALHKVVLLFQDCFPGKYKALHIINQPYVLDLLFNLVKRFISKKLANRITLHRNYSTLQGHIPAAILPSCLGGELADNEAFECDILPEMMSRDKWYQGLLKYGFKSKKIL